MGMAPLCGNICTIPTFCNTTPTFCKSNVVREENLPCLAASVPVHVRLRPLTGLNLFQPTSTFSHPEPLPRRHDLQVASHRLTTIEVFWGGLRYGNTTYFGS